MKNRSILVIEDTRAIAEQICDFLSSRKFQVDYADTGRRALNLIEKNQYDVIILDLMLPDMDGIEICRQVKQGSKVATPILMLTARDSIEDKIAGFEEGADDYLTKPFALEELEVRCVALARRHQLHKKTKISIGDLVIDVQQRKSERKNTVLNFTATDFDILLLLAEAYPNAVSRTQLTQKIWGDDFPESDVLRSHIYTLRNILDKPFNYPMIKTIHGVGFKLVELELI